MTDYPEAVRELVAFSMSEHARGVHVVADLIDAAIRDLKELLVAKERTNDTLVKERRMYRKRAEKAEYAAKENREAMDNAVAAWREAEAERDQYRTDLPEAVREFEEMRAGYEANRVVVWPDLLLQADAAIAALEAEVATWQNAYELADGEAKSLKTEMARLTKLKIAADEMNAALESERDKFYTLMWRIARRYGPDDMTASRVIEEESAHCEASADVEPTRWRSEAEEP